MRLWHVVGHLFELYSLGLDRLGLGQGQGKAMKARTDIYEYILHLVLIGLQFICHADAKKLVSSLQALTIFVRRI